ncbi:hypothetical protein CHS0354_020478, partial [Potamilus streckersoni]
QFVTPPVSLVEPVLPRTDVDATLDTPESTRLVQHKNVRIWCHVFLESAKVKKRQIRVNATLDSLGLDRTLA